MFVITGSRSVFTLDNDDLKAVYSPDWGEAHSGIEHFYGCAKRSDGGWIITTDSTGGCRIIWLDKNFNVEDIVVDKNVTHAHDAICYGEHLIVTNTGHDKLTVFNKKESLLHVSHIDWLHTNIDTRHLNSLCFGEETDKTWSLWVIEHEIRSIVKIVFSKQDINKWYVEKRLETSYPHLHSLSIRGNKIYTAASLDREILTICKNTGEILKSVSLKHEYDNEMWPACCYHDGDRIIVGGGTIAKRELRHHSTARLLIFDKDMNFIKKYIMPCQGVLYQIQRR